MGLKLFNTLSRSVEDFHPLDPSGKKSGLYCCGPTVHDFAHIGNFRTFVFADLLRRYLEFRGFQVQHVMNITDVEDKILARVRDANVPLRDYTSKYEAAFFEDLRTLNCLPPHATPRATEHLAEIISLIGKLVERGVAYRSPDGSVYFSIERYRQAGGVYGQLVKLNFQDMRPGERVDQDEYAKESIADFALWKARVPEDGSVFWPSPWGEGRPGWHIECSAMSMSALGPSFDVHVGGEDLIFPHHEDEIAQSEGAGVQSEGARFVKYWLHCAHLLVEGQKMSKSLGNFFTLRDLLDKGFSGREIRHLLISAHYREQFNFTLDGLKASREALARIDDCLARLREFAGRISTSQAGEAVITRITEIMDEDLNVSGAWGVVFDWVRDNNRLLASQQMTPDLAASAVGTWEKLDAIFGLGRPPAAEAPPEITALLARRQEARAAKDFKRADAFRDELKSKGWIIEDTPKGARLKKI